MMMRLVPRFGDVFKISRHGQPLSQSHHPAIRDVLERSDSFHLQYSLAIVPDPKEGLASYIFTGRDRLSLERRMRQIPTHREMPELDGPDYLRFRIHKTVTAVREVIEEAGGVESIELVERGKIFRVLNSFFKRGTKTFLYKPGNIYSFDD